MAELIGGDRTSSVIPRLWRWRRPGRRARNDAIPSSRRLDRPRWPGAECSVDTLPRLRPPSRPPLPRLRTAQNLSVSWAVLLCDSFWAVLLCVHGLSTERLNWLSTPIQSAVLTKFELVFVYSPDKVLCRHESKPAFWTTYMDKTATGIRKEGNINPRDSLPPSLYWNEFYSTIYQKVQCGYTETEANRQQNNEVQFTVQCYRAARYSASRCSARAGTPGDSTEDFGVAHHADEDAIVLRLRVRHPDVGGPVGQHLRHDRRGVLLPRRYMHAPRPPERYLLRLETDAPAAELLRPRARSLPWVRRG
jgi:hypothetical protein